MSNPIIETQLAAVAEAVSSPVEDEAELTPAILRMVDRGVSPEAISALLNVSHSVVSRITVHHHSRLVDDDEIPDMMRNLVQMAYGRAIEVMQFGPQSEQANLTRLIIAYALKSVAGESTSQYDEIRGEFENILGNMRRKDADNSDNAGFGFASPAINAFNSDEGIDD